MHFETCIHIKFIKLAVLKKLTIKYSSTPASRMDGFTFNKSLNAIVIQSFNKIRLQGQIISKTLQYTFIKTSSNIYCLQSKT